MKLKTELSHYGIEGPRNFGLIIRMNQLGFMIVFWKWYLDVRLVK